MQPLFESSAWGAAKIFQSVAGVGAQLAIYQRLGRMQVSSVSCRLEMRHVPAPEAPHGKRGRANSAKPARRASCQIRN